VATALLLAFALPLTSSTQLLAFTRRVAAAIDRNADERRSTAPRDASTRLLEAFGKLPLRFEPNRGQTRRDVKYVSRGSGYTLFLTPTEAVLLLRRGANEGDGVEAQTFVAQTSTLRLKLDGANRKPRVEGMDELQGRSNYFIGGDARAWHTDVPGYERVRYASVYPGTDLVFYGKAGQLEYDFHLAPNADPQRIRLRFEGARSIRLDENGDLVINVEGGDVRQQKPVIYQVVDDVRRAVEGGYVIHEERDAKGRTRDTFLVGFRVGTYDRKLPLVIDPVLI
jgi:hypothetical protein